MSGRDQALAAVLLFVVLSMAVTGANLGGADASLPVPPSTYRFEPSGASGLYEALERLGRRPERWRRSYRELPVDEAEERGKLLVVLGPPIALSDGEARQLIGYARSTGPVMLSGPGTAAAMGCWGWSVTWRGEDSIRVKWPGVPVRANAATVRWVLAPPEIEKETLSEETKAAGVVREPCNEQVASVDTLLTTAGARPVIVRIQTTGGYPVLLVADPALLTNRTLRESGDGPPLLDLVAGSTAGVRFDEYHHGRTSEQGMLDFVLAWSARSPWGWLAWQLLLIGGTVLIARIPRTGPIHTVIERKRRSPLEHVRALATALRAARGHDVAVGLLMRGLRRRLSRDGRHARDPIDRWVVQLKHRIRSPRARAAVARLEALTRPGARAEDVLATANAVEEVWQELRP